jgi:Mg-chelatase subunit ChlD
MNPYSNSGQNAPHTHFLTEAALYSCGFEQATRSSTPREIWNIHPHGGTAMRDALLYGNGLMLQLHAVLERESTASNWSFLHILITDGHDTDSNASYQQTYQALSALRADLNVRDLKVIILGVDIEYGYAQSLRSLIAAAGMRGEYHDITHTDIRSMFHRIRSEAGMLSRPNANLNAMNNMAKLPPSAQGEAGLEHFAVLFTLDISGSMSGHKWDVTRHATVDFIRYLGSNDLVSAIVFNDNPHLVMHWNTRQYQMQMAQMGTARPFEQVMRNEAYFDPYEFGQQGPPVSSGGYYNNNNLRQPLNGPTRYVVQDPYANEQCCCCL